MILAEVNTGFFIWTVLAETKAGANVALLQGYAKHCEQNRYAQPGVMRDLIATEEVTYTPITLGVALRDGDPI
jgi:hypothetical protein